MEFLSGGIGGGRQKLLKIMQDEITQQTVKPGNENKLHLVLAQSAQLCERWYQSLENKPLWVRYVIHPSAFHKLCPNDVVVVQIGDRDYNDLLHFTAIRNGFTIHKVELQTIQSCSTCQYFLLLGDSKICNALKSPAEDIDATNECGDWVVKI